MPNWAETLSSVNSDGDVFWSDLVVPTAGEETHAKFSLDGQLSSGVRLPVLDSERSSVAVNLTDRDANGTVWVVGSDSKTNALVDRKALLWRVGIHAGNISTAASLNLAQRVLPIGTLKADVAPQQSFAYGIAEIADGLLVVGSARARVSRDFFLYPVVWRVNTATNAFDGAVLSMPLGNNGVVRDIAAHPTAGFWACGNESAPGAYSQAVCWQLDASGNEVLGSRIVLNLGTTALATSIVNRVRTIPVGPGGAQESVAVGTLMTTDGKWKGWVYNLTAGNAANVLNDSFGLDENHDAMVFDVASLTYLDGAAKRYGMMVGGMSATLTNNGSAGGPPTAAPLRGIERRMLIQGAKDSG